MTAAAPANPGCRKHPTRSSRRCGPRGLRFNPATASDLGLERNDVVKIITPTSMIVAIVYPYAGIRPDVVAVPIGQGHAAYGRYAKNQGANVAAILSPQTDGGW